MGKQKLTAEGAATKKARETPQQLKVKILITRIRLGKPLVRIGVTTVKEQKKKVEKHITQINITTWQ